METRQQRQSKRCDGFGLILVIALIGVSSVIGLVVTWDLAVIQTRTNSTRWAARRDSAEAAVINLAVIGLPASVDKILGETQVAGLTEVNADSVASDLATKMRQQLTEVLKKSPKINLKSVAVEYKPFALAEETTDKLPYRDQTNLDLKAKPFVLREAPSNVEETNKFVEYVPTGHPLAGYAVRRFPFYVVVKFGYQDEEITIERRVSLYQLPLAQFARFAAGHVKNQEEGADVSLKSDSRLLAFGTVSAGVSPFVSRMIAAQVEQEKQGVDDFYNLGAVQTGNSRMGGRLTGEQWTLHAPHFFTRREQGEKIISERKPVVLPGQPIPKAYEAFDFLEVTSHLDRVRTADPTAGFCTLRQYNENGDLVASWEGRMTGQDPSETPPWEESVYDENQSLLERRQSVYSRSAPFPAGGRRSVSVADFIAPVPGNYVFRIVNPGGDAIRILVDTVEVLKGQGNEWTSAVPIQTGMRRIVVERVGGNGMVEMTVTPPGLSQAWISQWSIAPGSTWDTMASFGRDFPLSGAVSCRILPPQVHSNATGRPTVALIVHVDGPWPFTSKNGNTVLYCEGVAEGQARQYNTQTGMFSDVVVEVAGSGFGASVRANNSLTIISPNPVVLNGSFVGTSYDGFFVISRGVLGPDRNSVFFGYDQAQHRSLDVTGVVSGEIAQMVSYYDRLSPQKLSFIARAANDNLAPVFKNLVLIDDFYLEETYQFLGKERDTSNPNQTVVSPGATYPTYNQGGRDKPKPEKPEYPDYPNKRPKP